MYLCANSNNRAATVLQCFLTAVSQHGLPHRVRSDKGGENVEVARYMLEHPERGPGRMIFVIVVHVGCYLPIPLSIIQQITVLLVNLTINGLRL